MAHGKNAEARPDKEWWGKRPLRHYTITTRSGVNKFFKRLLHKMERKVGKQDILEQLNDGGDL